MSFDGRVERGLLMSAPLVVQTMRGRKTNTRRIGDRYRRWRKGDLVYIRETFRPPQCIPCEAGVMGPCICTSRPHVTYRADDDNGRRGWKPGIHMPKWAARIWCELTEDVRYEPLQAISVEDILAEGVDVPDVDYSVPEHPWVLESERAAFAVDAFSTLWDRINGKRGPEDDPDAFTWARNPEVAVLRYRLLSTTGRPA